MSWSIRLALLATAITVSPALASADTIKVGDTVRVLGTTGTLSGGAFSLDVTQTGVGVDFLTFCLQRSQYIDYSNLFTVGGISDAADDLGGADPLSLETKWIYANFRANALGAYSADDIQAAIWTLENEWQNPGFGNSAALIALAQSAVAGGYVNNQVKALNLFDANGTAAQDQLTLVVPEPASLALFGLGLVATARAARRRRK